MSLPSTLQEFCTFYEKSPENKQVLYDLFSFGLKERMRYRDKDKRRRERIKAEKALLPPAPRKKPGPKGPWKLYVAMEPILEN